MGEFINEKEHMISIGDELMHLQESLNDGRGHSTVRYIAEYLKRGDIESARAIYENDGDKIAADLYPEIVVYIVRNLYNGEPTCRKFNYEMALERLQDQNPPGIE